MTPPNPFALAETDTLRNAGLPDLVEMLRKQADIRYDGVVSASALKYEDGLLRIEDGALRFEDEGVTSAPAVLRPTATFEDQVAEKLGVPTKYLRRLRDDAIAHCVNEPQGHWDDQDKDASATALLDHNVNHWLMREPDRRFLLRAFRTDDADEIGVARSFLSDRFGMIDNLDVVMAALKGIADAGVTVEIDGCDLSANRMSVRVSAPEVQALAPILLGNYRSPFGEDNGGVGALNRWRGIAAREGLGYEPGKEPVVFAGFAIENSETGGGAFLLTPRLILRICRNGLTIKVDALRKIHLGARLDEGLIRWSDDTAQKSIELVTAKARDAVATFLDKDYIEKVVAGIEEKAGTRVDEPVKVVERVSKQFGFSEVEQNSILSAFVSSGQVTAGGILNAVTAAAQTIADPDRAAEVEGSALDVLDFVAAN